MKTTLVLLALLIFSVSCSCNSQKEENIKYVAIQLVDGQPNGEMKIFESQELCEEYTKTNQGYSTCAKSEVTPQP